MAAFDLFISHSSNDKGFVWRLRTDLDVYGYKVWVDEEHLRIGTGLSPALERAIRDSRFVAAVHSVSSAISPGVDRECRYATAVGVPVIPILLDQVSLTDETREQFYADFTHRDDQHAYHRAFHDVLTLLGMPKPSGELHIYADGLSRGWLNSSWDARCTERYTMDDGHGGGRCCFRAHLLPFGGVAFVFRSGIDTSPFSCLQFSLHGGDTGGQAIKVFVNDRIGNGMRNQVSLKPLPSRSWRAHSVSLDELDAARTIIFKVNWSHAHGDLTGPIHLAEVEFTG